jgi:hypothetical protein
MSQKWRFVDTTKECYLLKELPRNDAFIRFSLIGGQNRATSYLDIFRRFVTDEVMDDLQRNFRSEDLILSNRTYRDKFGVITSVVPSSFKLSRRYMWQALAVQIRIIGRHEKKKGIQKIIQGCIDYFGKENCAGRASYFFHVTNRKLFRCNLEKLY